MRPVRSTHGPHVVSGLGRDRSQRYRSAFQATTINAPTIEMCSITT